MAKKLRNPEMLVAEIHTLNSKIRSLQAQGAANEEKLKRLSSNQQLLKTALASKKTRLDHLMKLAQQNGIQF